MGERKCALGPEAHWIERAQAHRFVDMLDAKVRLPEKCSCPSAVDQRSGQIGTKRERTIENSWPFVEIVSNKDERITCSPQCGRVVGAQFHRPAREPCRFRDDLLSTISHEVIAFRYD